MCNFETLTDKVDAHFRNINVPHIVKRGQAMIDEKSLNLFRVGLFNDYMSTENPEAAPDWLICNGHSRKLGLRQVSFMLHMFWPVDELHSPN